MPNILTKEQVVRLKEGAYIDYYGYVLAIRDLIATLEAAWEERDALHAKLHGLKKSKVPLSVYHLKQFFDGVG